MSEPTRQIPADAGRGHPAETRTVLLEHTLPDGQVHYDWLFARDGPGDDDTRDVRTIRCPVRIDRLEPGRGRVCERREDHRRLYLRHEGAVPGDRGHVRRIAEGAVAAIEVHPMAIAERGAGGETAPWDVPGLRFTVRIVWIAADTRETVEVHYDLSPPHQGGQDPDLGIRTRVEAWYVRCVSRRW